MNAPNRLEKLLHMRAELDELIAEEQQRAANDTVTPSRPGAPVFMKPAAYARRRDVSLRTIQRWVKLGLPHETVGAITRIRVAEADRWTEPKAIARDAEVDAAGGGRR